MNRINHILLALIVFLLPMVGFAADIKNAYGTSNQAITITLASLANDVTGPRTGRQSTEIDNTTNKFIDALVFLKVLTASAATSATGHVDVYAYGTADGGTTRTETAGATDAAITLTDPPNARLIGVCNTVANSITYNCGPFRVSIAFGGILPDKWGIIVINESGAALNATEANHGKWYQGVYATSI